MNNEPATLSLAFIFIFYSRNLQTEKHKKHGGGVKPLNPKVG